MEEPMAAVDFIITLFCRVNAHMHDIPKHPHVTLWASEVVTLGLLHALKDVGTRAFYRWLTRDVRVDQLASEVIQDHGAPGRGRRERTKNPWGNCTQNDTSTLARWLSSDQSRPQRGCVSRCGAR